MARYDVACGECGSEDLLTIAMKDLDQWDQDAKCPSCGAGGPTYRRVIKSAPAVHGGQTRPSRSFTSGERDDMRHKEGKRRSPDQVAAAVESVRRGTNEGF